MAHLAHDPTPHKAAWLKRTRKELRISGRLAQVARQLAQNNLTSTSEWEKILIDLIEERSELSLENLILIDGMLAKPRAVKVQQDAQLCLF